jgi:triosephosphate isomerase (TIM)
MGSRRPVIAGNWKMNTTLEGALALAKGIADAASKHTGADAIVIPPACFLAPVMDALQGSSVGVGAQNMHPADKGAYTGELSAGMLQSLGVHYVVCGHSERRHIFGESSDWVGDKVRAAVAAGLRPILCVGETLEDRDAGITEAVVAEQLLAGLRHLNAAQMHQTIVAYEPVWAIGTGRTASPEQAQAVHAFIRTTLANRFDPATSDRARLQYGGSVKPQNARELLLQPDIDGALVGGASLKAESFAGILAATTSA